MTPRQQLLAVISTLVMFLVVFELVRLRKLKEEYSWLWFGSSLIILLLAVIPSTFTLLCHWLDVTFPSSAIFFMGLIFFSVLGLQLSMRGSELTTKVKDLAQDNALLRERLERLEQKTQAEESPPAPPDEAEA